MSIHSWSRSSFSYYKSAATLTGNYVVFPVTIEVAADDCPDADRFPDTCNIQSVEFEFLTLGTATTVTMYLARDSAGDVPITPSTTTGATQTISIGATTATKGGAAFAVDNDYHRDSSVANTNQYTIYVVAKVSGGTPTANIRVNWRG
jgi:hypothetical protein